MNKIVCLIICLLLASCQTKTGINVARSGTFTGDAISKGERTIIDGGVRVTLDEQDRKIMDSTSPRTIDRIDRGEPITISDIIKLAQGGINDETIIRYIHSTKTTYHLTQAQIRRLRQGGVSQRVIKYIFDARDGCYPAAY